MSTNMHMTWIVTGKGLDHIGPSSPCYELPGLPPPDDFVVCVDKDGRPTRWSDSRWPIGFGALNFGYEPDSRQRLELTALNGELLKRCDAWFMWGDRRAITNSTLSVYHTCLKSIFAACSRLTVPIAASEMGRFFETIEPTLAGAIRPSNRDVTIALLHELWGAREWLGFELLAPAQIARLRQLVPEHHAQQNEFIAPRIWAYQTGRMSAFLEDFTAHKEQFEALHREIADAYRKNFGSLAAVRQVNNCRRNPCQQTKFLPDCVNLGAFVDVARRHGVADVMARWVIGRGAAWEDLSSDTASVRMLSKYFNAVGLVGTAYLQCMSGMRIAEVMSLRSDCLRVEHDPVLGNIHILAGETTKTNQDQDARWITAPSAASAVDAMRLIALWRTEMAIELGNISLTEADRSNPYLVQRGYEPWAYGQSKSAEPSKRPLGYDIGNWRSKVPGLFDEDALRITTDDALYVRRFSANADLGSYGEGSIWHFASHQYRRTVQVMMAASGVSLESRQQQLKHLTLSQSAYYAQGFESLRLNRTFRDELVSTRYELVSVEAGLLNGPEYVSPHGEERKSELLHFFTVSSRDEIAKAQRKALLTVKQTLFGICTKSSCEFGGLDNYVHCPTCVDGLMDRRKRARIEVEGRTIAVRLIDVPLGTPLRVALEAKARAIRGYMDVTA